ncbi:MAG TPA: LysM peptidoglycan-binding domain-containing protein [Anaerolineales bacterium]|nr:LysM peptidoglycan-binding domain-containing protein [Anaerolineales bacterium]
MKAKTIFCLLIFLALAAALSPTQGTRAAQPAAPQAEVTAYDMIIAMNTLRVSYGYPALIEDPIVNAVAQATAEYMAANQMSWHIGDVRGRIAAAGYGGGATVWATENFAVGNMTIDTIMQVWADPDHMRPATTAAYCHVGAGVARSANGMTYYILQAAYTSENACGAYNYGDTPPQTGGTPNPVAQLIVPVQVATPDENGQLFHVVATGQSFWAIAIAYGVTIHDLEVWNNLSSGSALQVGQRLFIPSANTEGYATPTPVGMVVPSTPDADGKVFHTVQAYQTLTTIAQAYGVTVDTVLVLNGLQLDWPLQINQVLMISPGQITPSPTPRPLTPIERLTPASDGNYYHVVGNGETLSWIASLYNITVMDLMGWNGLNNTSIIQPDQKLILQVTPPATITPTPAPPTITPTISPTRPLPTATRTPSPLPASPGSPTATPAPEMPLSGPAAAGIVLVLMGVTGLILYQVARRQKN